MVPRDEVVPLSRVVPSQRGKILKPGLTTNSIDYDPPNFADDRALVYLLPPELLMAIFSQLRKRSLAQVARVCCGWTSVALDLIWESIPKFSILLQTNFSGQWRNGVSY